MGRPSLIALILLAVIGSWMFFNEVPLHRLPWQIPSAHTISTSSSDEPLITSPGRIRIATFNLDGFDIAKAAEQDVMVALAHILARFDLVALQEIESHEHHLVPRLVDEVNRRSGAHYEFVVGPRVGRGDRQRQFAFVFNRDSIEIDRYATYTINDPDDLITYEPLVGCFRARRPPADRAFTFSLVNLRIEEQEAARESELLRSIFTSVQDDGRFEDDVMLLGDFQSSTQMLRAQVALPGMTFIVGEASWAEERHDNLMLETTATREFTGRSGVFDIVRELNVDAPFAKRISRHFPVWAEFSDHEGGLPGRVAVINSVRCTR